MSDPNRNAAIWYAADGYDPKKKGLNGRRIAGQSFLRGFLEHADVDVFQSITNGQTAAKEFADLAAPYAKGRSIKNYHLIQTGGLQDLSTVYYPSPTLAGEAWRRFHVSQTAYSLCGVTHTTATQAIMNGLFENRTAPVEPWDGVICTSKSVYDHVQYQLDLFDEYAGKRFDAKSPKRFNTTTIPLGIHTGDFEPDEKRGNDLRQELEIGQNDVVFLVLSRLSPQEKFDPIPLYRALRLAQEQCNETIHLILCGYFGDKISERVFRAGAEKAMPHVKLHVVDGKNADKRKAALSGADVFLFPIDNLQETFGLAPVEAMAAGLPLIVSDWDGMKDTVTPDVGFRIPTRTVSPQHTKVISRRYQTGVDSYPQYTTLNAAMTQIDVVDLTRRLVQLIQNPGLRKKMGAAGKARAKALYDWKVVMPQMQDYFAELTAIRKSASAEDGAMYQGMDCALSPNSGDLFAGYPTQQGGLEGITLVATRGSNANSITGVVETRGYKRIKRELEPVETLARVHTYFAAAEQGSTIEAMRRATGLTAGVAERSVVFLLKYDLLREK